MAHTRHMHMHRNPLGVFDRADRYDRHSGRLFGRLYTAVAAEVAAAGLPSGARVLDAGTGPGRVPVAIAAARPGLRVDGIDMAPAMIEVATRRATEAGLAGRVTFVVGDVAGLPYPDGTFDLVVSTISQHHWPDPAAGFRELRRVLRPGGRAWIYDFRPALGRAERAATAAFPGQPGRARVRGAGLPGLLVRRLTVTA